MVFFGLRTVGSASLSVIAHIPFITAYDLLTVSAAVPTVKKRYAAGLGGKNENGYEGKAAEYKGKAE